MSKEQSTIELIESYLEHTMSPEAREGFESLLRQDPMLRSEFEMQQQLINAIQDFRKDQLKAQLQNVPVNLGPGAIFSLKTAAIVALATIIGVGAYFYFQKEEPVKIDLAEQSTTTEPNSSLPDQPVISETVEQVMQEPVLEEEAPSSNTENLGKASAGVAQATPKPAVTQDLTQPVIIPSPKVIQPVREEDLLNEELEHPQENLAQADAESSSAVSVESTYDKNYGFHYQFYQDKLFLYGDFKNDPYEILELNFSNGKRLYLYYQEAYYQLKDNQINIAPLELLADSETIKKLEIIKANK